jgi:hypothetical protein
MTGRQSPKKKKDEDWPGKQDYCQAKRSYGLVKLSPESCSTKRLGSGPVS